MKFKYTSWQKLFCLGLIALNLGLASFVTQAAEIETLIGKKVPSWDLLGLDGEKVSSDQYKGKITILNFWATWCPPCRAEIPDFMKLHDSYKDKNVVVLGISLDTGLGPVKRFVRTQKLNYPILMGNAKLVSELGNFSAIPQTFIIDDEGRVHTQFQGLVKFETLEKKLKSMIGENTPND